MAKHIDAHLRPADPHRCQNGYHVTIVDVHTGECLLNTTRHPATGKTLASVDQCLQVISFYTER